VFNDSVGVDEFLQVPRALLESHGLRFLVLATTHSEYPLRSYREELPRRKAEALRQLALKLARG
jgi:hypothetical protein